MWNKKYSPGQDGMPGRIIVGVGDDLRHLRRAIASPELPTIDLDVLLTYIVDAVNHEREAPNELHALPHTLMSAEVLGARVKDITLRCRKHDMWSLEDPWENILGLETVLHHAVTMGHALHRTLREIRLFEDQYLQFAYDGVLDDRSILLRRRRR